MSADEQWAEWVDTLDDNIEDLRDEVDALRADLKAALGYMLNAKIDLETGAPKSTALATLNGGIARIRAAVERVES